MIPTIISQALTGAILQLGTLETRRDFTFVEDTARGFVAVAASDAAVGQVVNVGSGTEVTIGDIVMKVEQIVGHKLEVAVDDRRLRPENSEVSRLLADSSKALKLAGWSAEVSLDEGLGRTVDWIRAHLDEYRTEEYAV